MQLAVTAIGSESPRVYLPDILTRTRSGLLWCATGWGGRVDPAQPLPRVPEQVLEVEQPHQLNNDRDEWRRYQHPERAEKHPHQ